ncbi:MAG: LPS export ABC transporter periplasmic protein LptC [Flavobacteriaceae bacterium]
MTITIVIMLFSCEGNYNKIQKMNLKDDAPFGIVKKMNTKFTDSGKMTVNLMAPLMYDYSNYSFPYNEFPEGITLYFWEDGEKSTVISDYAIKYENTGLIDLRNNVKIITADSLIVNANQLYWDQKNEWVFTDSPYKIIFPDGSYNDGQGFNSSQDFTTFLSRKNQGVQLIDNNELKNGN